MLGKRMGQWLFAETVACTSSFLGDFNRHVHDQYKYNEI